MTQYESIVSFMRRRRKPVTYHQLAQWTNWPHKRLAELESRGYRFERTQSNTRPAHVLVRLVGCPK